MAAIDFPDFIPVDSFDLPPSFGTEIDISRLAGLSRVQKLRELLTNLDEQASRGGGVVSILGLTLEEARTLKAHGLFGHEFRPVPRPNHDTKTWHHDGHGTDTIFLTTGLIQFPSEVVLREFAPAALPLRHPVEERKLENELRRSGKMRALDMSGPSLHYLCSKKVWHRAPAAAQNFQTRGFYRIRRELNA